MNFYLKLYHDHINMDEYNFQNHNILKDIEQCNIIKNGDSILLKIKKQNNIECYNAPLYFFDDFYCVSSHMINKNREDIFDECDNERKTIFKTKYKPQTYSEIFKNDIHILNFLNQYNDNDAIEIQIFLNAEFLFSYNILNKFLKYNGYPLFEMLNEKCFKNLYDPPFCLNIKMHNYENDECVNITTHNFDNIEDILNKTLQDIFLTYHECVKYINSFDDEYFLHIDISFMKNNNKKFHEFFIISVLKLKKIC